MRRAIVLARFGFGIGFSLKVRRAIVAREVRRHGVCSYCSCKRAVYDFVDLGFGQLPMAEHVKLVVDLKTAGKLITVYQFRPGREAKTVRVRSGRRVVEDGPFTGTEEAVGALYLIECDSQDEAMAWADKLTIFDWESIEVRRLWTD